MNKWIVFGANSDIACSTLLRLANGGDCFYLTSKNEERLNQTKLLLLNSGASKVITRPIDVSEPVDYRTLFENVKEEFGCISGAFIAQGLLIDESEAISNPDDIRYCTYINAISVIEICSALIPTFKEQQYGKLVVITSVAGDRGKSSNPVYSASKSMASRYLQGLRQQLNDSKINIIEIRPGMVDTKMTRNLALKSPLLSNKEVIAEGIIKAIEKNREITYLPGYWRVIMTIIKLIPESIFKRLKL